VTKVLLLDGDVVAYRFAYSAEVAVEWEEDQWTVTADAKKAREDMLDYIEGVRWDLKADTVVVALSHHENFRKSLYPDYKANRTGRKPIILKPMREALASAYESYIIPTLEADDVIGRIATAGHTEFEYVVASIDKDFLSIPGRHYDLNSKTSYKVTEAEADYWHMLQTLTGDRVDNYPGCPGVGLKRAEKLLDPLKGDLPAMWAAVVKAYEKAKLTEEDALLQARLARILRSSDWNTEEEKVILWNPPKDK
jgi:DNA polymerase-1